MKILVLVIISFLVSVWLPFPASDSHTLPACFEISAMNSRLLQVADGLKRRQDTVQSKIDAWSKNSDCPNMISHVEEAFDAKVKAMQAKLDEYKAEVEKRLSGVQQNAQQVQQQVQSVFGEDPEDRQAAGPSAPIPPDTPDSDPVKENKRRQEKVKEGFLHAWNGYKKYAWGFDELMPLSKRGKNWAKSEMGAEGTGLGMTIIDSLTTLWLLGLKDEFALAVDWVNKKLTFDVDTSISVFETTIRLVGGLVSAYQLSGEKHQCLLDKARDLGDRLLKAYDTPTGIPNAEVNLKTGVSSNPRWTGGGSILSEFGTVQLEWRVLSQLTKSDVYDKKGTHITNVIEKRLPPDGLPPTYFNTLTGKWASDHITLGALGDSYYEYLLKQYLLTGKTEPRYRKLFVQAAGGILDKLVQKTSHAKQVYLAEQKRGGLMHKMDHLACFAGGLFALAATEIPDHKRSKDWMKLGRDLTETCHIMYTNTATGLSPEVGEFEGSDFTPGAPYYILRPETVESYFYLWRLTKEQKYRDYGWQMFRALDHWCRVESGGYSGLKNVDMVPPMKDDLMQSFLLAETFKYLYLLFSPDGVLDLSKWVINTEAHPLRIKKQAPPPYKDAPLPGIPEGYANEMDGDFGGGLDRSEVPTPPGYRLLRNKDAPNADLSKTAATVRDPGGLAELCNTDPKCQGFNTNGYLKAGVTSVVDERACDLYLKETVADKLAL